MTEVANLLICIKLCVEKKTTFNFPDGGNFFLREIFFRIQLGDLTPSIFQLCNMGSVRIRKNHLFSQTRDSQTGALLTFGGIFSYTIITINIPHRSEKLINIGQRKTFLSNENLSIHPFLTDEKSA